MLAEGITALAAAFGVAVVQAVGTDTWRAFRDRAAQVAGRGNETDTRAELERLDRTAAALHEAEHAERERVGLRQEGAWQDHIETLLRSLTDEECARLAAGFSALAEEQARGNAGGVSGNTFFGPTGVQGGRYNQQTNHFGRGR